MQMRVRAVSIFSVAWVRDPGSGEFGRGLTPARRRSQEKPPPCSRPPLRIETISLQQREKAKNKVAHHPMIWLAEMSNHRTALRTCVVVTVELRARPVYACDCAEVWAFSPEPRVGTLVPGLWGYGVWSSGFKVGVSEFRVA